MKRIGIMLSANLIVLMMLFTSYASANGEMVNEDYFADKWAVLLIGIPNGDATMIVHFSRKDGELIGVVTDESGETEMEIERIIEREDSITFYWTAEGHYVNVDLKKVDDNKMTGSLMGMFDVTAERILE